MTTLEPGAREVLTHGLRVRPLSTALRASRPAPIITLGLEVLVQEVIAAITTSPWSRSNSSPLAIATGEGLEIRSGMPSRVDTCSGLRSAVCPPGVGASEAGKDSRPASLALEDTSPVHFGRTSRRPFWARVSGTRSCGRVGPASEGTTVDRSRLRVSA